MANREEQLKAQVREMPLPERLEKARAMIGNMCSEGRPPKMTIPVQWYDEDFFISTTLKDAKERIAALEKEVAELAEWKKAERESGT